jgi:hypothetical protein
MHLAAFRTASRSRRAGAPAPPRCNLAETKRVSRFHAQGRRIGTTPPAWFDSLAAARAADPLEFGGLVEQAVAGAKADEVDGIALRTRPK